MIVMRLLDNFLFFQELLHSIPFKICDRHGFQEKNILHQICILSDRIFITDTRGSDVVRTRLESLCNQHRQSVRQSVTKSSHTSYH